jgi:two-component system nitrogen regulation response regulator NtrX
LKKKSSPAISEDLFRLNVVPFTVPPLRERKEDISLLMEHFMILFCRMEGRDCKVFSPEALKLMENYEWPGNVRELKNIIERLVIMIPDTTIQVSHLPSYMIGLETFKEDTASRRGNLPDHSTLREAREEFEKEFILQKLEENQWNISKTAESIELERSNLYRKIKSYGIDMKK